MDMIKAATAAVVTIGLILLNMEELLIIGGMAIFIYALCNWAYTRFKSAVA